MCVRTCVHTEQISTLSHVWHYIPLFTCKTLSKHKFWGQLFWWTTEEPSYSGFTPFRSSQHLAACWSSYATRYMHRYSSRHNIWCLQQIKYINNHVPLCYCCSNCSTNRSWHNTNHTKQWPMCTYWSNKISTSVLSLSTVQVIQNWLVYFEYAPYSVCTLSCTSSGSCGKLVRPAAIHSTVAVPHPLHPGTGHVCAADVCKTVTSTTSTGRVTDQPIPAGDRHSQSYI